MSKREHAGPPRLVLYGHFGAGNFGNDSTLEAVLANIRKIQPAAILTCVCTGPRVISDQYGIPTLPVDISENNRGNQLARHGLRIIPWIAKRIVDEISFWLSRTHWFRTIDQFIIVGTGAVDDMAVRPWNAPYDLYKWSRAAWLGGAKVVFLSIGAGPIVNQISRVLMVAALRVADFRSYRDEASMGYLRSIGFNTTDDSICPDLVFSLPIKEIEQLDNPSRQPKIVGIGVIGYYGWRHEPVSGEPLYQSYIRKLMDFTAWLLEKGYSIRLLIGNLGVDQRPVDDLREFIATMKLEVWKDHIFIEPISNTQELFQQISKTDVVIASRFHNIVCALMMGRPVISIGYHIKNESLMAQMGLEDYCLHIEHFSVETLIQQFQSLISDIGQASSRIQDKCDQYRQELDRQYRKILLY